jgi:hypothetical protein
MLYVICKYSLRTDYIMFAEQFKEGLKEGETGRVARGVIILYRKGHAKISGLLPIASFKDIGTSANRKQL